jgi:aryl carrier-like protein
MCGDTRLANDRLDNLVGYGLDGRPITARDLHEAWRKEHNERLEQLTLIDPPEGTDP